MAAEEAWTCSICRDVRHDVAYATPCNHMFCLGCIQRWARLKDSCPLCRTAMNTIRVSVRGDNEYVECIVSPPAVPVPVGFGTTTGPTGLSGTAASAPLSAPPSPEPMAAEQERVGGLLPEVWAALFRAQADILDPVLPWLEQELHHHGEQRWWKIKWLKSMILAFLCQVGPDRDILVQCTEHALGPIAAPLIDALVTSIESRCGQRARRLLGLEDPSADQEQQDGPEDPSAAQEREDGPAAPSGPSAYLHGAVTPDATPASCSAGPDAEELPGTSSGALGTGPAEEPGLEAAGPSEQRRSRGPSARGRGRKRSAGGPRRPTKRRAGSAQRAHPPCKRRPPRSL